jgi:hypothetical protein
MSAQPLYKPLEAFLLSLGADVKVRETKTYQGFWHDADGRERVFAYVQVRAERIAIAVRPLLPVQGTFVTPAHGKVCCRRISLRTPGDLEAAKPLLHQAYRHR